jgi:16S rRNA (cytosine1402-N4)-methyltransferase
MDQDHRKPSDYHTPVLADEVVELLGSIEEGVVVDATFGGGGHTRRLMGAMGAEVRIIGIDRDPDAQANAEALGVELLRGDFADLDVLLDGAGVGSIDGLLLDLGISSHQVDVPSRGFSYREDGPLDMRMDPSAGPDAAEIVNSASLDELVRILRDYGEERFARRIATAIVEARPLTTTLQLAEVVSAAVPAPARRAGHPARKTFQALRIAVNRELDALERGLDAGLDRLAPGGRCVVISYHSLEDRMVKRRFAEGTRGCTCPPELPVCACGADPEFVLLTRGAVVPSEEEVAANPRARSARLRAVERKRAA